MPWSFTGCPWWRSSPGLGWVRTVCPPRATDPRKRSWRWENHPYLGIFVGLGTVITILVIAASYSQIVELFPTGGGGYFVASKLLSPWVGMVSGCAC